MNIFLQLHNMNQNEYREKKHGSKVRHPLALIRIWTIPYGSPEYLHTDRHGFMYICINVSGAIMSNTGWHGYGFTPSYGSPRISYNYSSTSVAL